MTVGAIFKATIADESDEERRELERFVPVSFPFSPFLPNAFSPLSCQTRCPSRHALQEAQGGREEGSASTSASFRSSSSHRCSSCCRCWFDHYPSWVHQGEGEEEWGFRVVGSEGEGEGE